MTSPWTAHSPEDSERATFDQLERDHDSTVSGTAARGGVRHLVQESWVRSLSLRLDPSTIAPEHELSANELRDLRSRHPLSSVLPVVHNLLIRHAFDAGLIVAVGDESGRLLWIDGDRMLRRKAEEMMLHEGADCSERRVGTSASGTALALNHGVQTPRAEHFNRLAHPWSCTAVPIHDPESGVVLGVIDITGGADAVAPQTLPLVEAAVAAIEAELRIQRLGLAADQQGLARVGLALTPTPRRREAPAGLSILGSDNGQLTVGGTTVEISPRHAEILALLAWHRQGLSADRLALMLSDQASGVDTVRAEMVRVRKVLDTLSPRIVISSRPYRLESPLEMDAQRVLAFLDRGAHRVALGAYRGAVLPNSQAPGIVELRDEVSARLRESMLNDATPDLLLDYARSEEATYDTEVWRACLELLPPRSPKRATVVARLARIGIELNRRESDQPGHRNLSQRLMP